MSAGERINANELEKTFFPVSDFEDCLKAAQLACASW